MSNTMGSVVTEDVSGSYGTRINSKNNMNSINSKEIDGFNFDFFGKLSETPIVDMKGGIRLEGKYVNDSGKSFDADYYYSTDGTYNVSYKDGYKDVKIKFNVDGSKTNLEVNYKDPSSKNDFKEITNYESNGEISKSIYEDGKLNSNEVTSKDGTVITSKYCVDGVIREKIVKPDGSWQETIYGKCKNFGKDVITKDNNGNVIKTKYDFGGQKIQEELKNSSGIITEIRSYISGKISKVVLNDEFGEKMEEKIYKDGEVRKINLPDGKSFDYDENGNLTYARVGNNLQLQYVDGKIIRVSGENNIDIRYNEDGSLYSVIFDDAEAAKSNISFEIEKNKYTREEVSKATGYTLSGTIKEVVFSKDADGMASNLIVSTDGQMVSVTSRTDEINIDVSGLENYLSAFDGYANGYTNI